MSGHTPGPWLHGQNENISWVSRLDEPDAVVIEHHTLQDHYGEDRYIWQPSTADLQLIAAAPELLAALKAVHDWAGEGYHDTIPGELLRKASDAIDKAEGRA